MYGRGGRMAPAQDRILELEGKVVEMKEARDKEQDRPACSDYAL